MKATIRDVAREAGVSIASVSNALNGKKKVSAQTMQRIEEAAHRLGYSADPAASSLKSRNSHRIGLILPCIDSAFFPAVIDALLPILEAHGYLLSFYSTGFDPERERACVESLLADRADGIVLDSVSTDGAYFRELSQLRMGSKRIPVVAMEQDLAQYGLSSVYVDNRAGGAMAAEHLLACGVKHPVHIHGLRTAPWARERCEGFWQVFREAGSGAEEARTVQGDFTLQSGRLAAEELMKRGIAMDGLFAANDLMAMGAMKALQEAGLRIPEEIALMGFDDTSLSPLVSPSLTSIEVPKTELGVQAGQVLLRALQSGGETAEDICLPLQLLARQSTKTR